MIDIELPEFEKVLVDNINTKKIEIHSLNSEIRKLEKERDQIWLKNRKAEINADMISNLISREQYTGYSPEIKEMMVQILLKSISN